MIRPIGFVTPRRVVAAIVATGCAVPLAACSGASTAAPNDGVGEEFAARAAEVCLSAVESKEGWEEFPVAGFDPTDPDGDAFPQVARWLDEQVAPTFEGWLVGLEALGSPPTGRASWDEVLIAVRHIVELNDAQIAAARGGDAEGFAEAADDLEAAQTDLEDATAAAGVPTCADVHED